MKVYLVFLVVGLLSVATCSDKSSMPKYNIYQTKLDINHELFTHLLSDDNYHYLFGAIEGNQLDYRTSEITIEQSDIGDEKNWNSFSKKIPGKYQAVCQTKKYIYLISRLQYQEPQDPTYSKHKLYRILRKNGTIEELYEWDKGNSFIRDVYFDSEEIGFIFFRPSGNPLDYQLFITNNGGKDWKSYEIKKPVGKTQSNNERLYFLSYKSNNENNWIYSIEKKSKELDSLQFELNITDFVASEIGDYWLLGQDGDKTVLQHYKDGKTLEIKTFSEDAEFFPNQLYKYNDVIVVLASKVDKSMLGGFGGTKPAIYFSIDSGLTWKNHQLDEALYVKPVSFYRDEQMTAYVGDGKILTCSLR